LLESALLLRHQLGYPSAAGKDQRCDQAACPREAPDHGVRESVFAGQGRAQQPSPEP
jgi:hypothetical protein